jgi:hypothetical protein
MLLSDIRVLMLSPHSQTPLQNILVQTVFVDVESLACWEVRGRSTAASSRAVAILKRLQFAFCTIWGFHVGEKSPVLSTSMSVLPMACVNTSQFKLHCIKYILMTSRCTSLTHNDAPSFSQYTGHATLQNVNVTSCSLFNDAISNTIKQRQTLWP